MRQKAESLEYPSPMATALGNETETNKKTPWKGKIKKEEALWYNHYQNCIFISFFI